MHFVAGQSRIDQLVLKVRPNSSEDRNIEKRVFGTKDRDFEFSEIPGSYYFFSMPGISKSSYS